MRSTRFIFGSALAAAAVSVITQGCGVKNDGSGFSGTGGGDDAGGGVVTTGPDGSVTSGSDAGSFNLGDASFKTDGSPSFDPDAGCATTVSSAARQAVYMLVVLDGSGSMAVNPSDNSPAQKWAAVVPALDAFFDDLKTNPDPGFGVGLTIFSDQNDQNCTTQYGIMDCGNGTYPTMNVPIAAVDATQAKALHDRIDPTKPNDGTPTVAVLKGQYAALESFDPTAAHLPPGGKKVVVLITDGVPNDDNNTPTATLQQQCVNMAKTELAKTPSITTFVVGVGNYQPLNTDDYDPAFLGALAQAGGAGNPGCDPSTTSDPGKMCHFQITPGNKSAQQLEQDFLNAINAIRGKASCTFQLELPDGGGVDPSKVNVVQDDGHGNKTTIPQDPTDGWTYDDPKNPSTITLHGHACDGVKNSISGTVTIVLGCATVVK